MIAVVAIVVAVAVFVLFLSGLRPREGYETNDEEKRKNNLNLHLSKSLHHNLDSYISDHPGLRTIIFLKLYPMG